jgi:predicted alpha/beta-fold hydrolase
MVEAGKHGFRAIVFGYRGYRVGLRNLMVNCGVDVSDIVVALRYIRKLFIQSEIYMVGFSAGANMLVKALGEVCGFLECMKVKLRFFFRDVMNALIWFLVL